MSTLEQWRAALFAIEAKNARLANASATWLRAEATSSILKPGAGILNNPNPSYVPSAPKPSGWDCAYCGNHYGPERENCRTCGAGRRHN